MAGPRGTDGNTILTFDGEPDPQMGKEGDYAFNTRQFLWYGPKTPNGWGKGTQLRVAKAALDDAIREFNSRTGPGGGRFFGMGAPSAGIAAAPQAGGWQAVQGNGMAFPANKATTVAEDPTGVAFKAIILAEASPGNAWMGEVDVFRSGAATSYVVAWEHSVGTPPVVTFTPVAGATGLELQMTSDIPLDSIRGKYEYL